MELDFSVKMGDGIITEVKLELLCDDAHVDTVVELIRENVRAPTCGYAHTATGR